MSKPNILIVSEPPPVAGLPAPGLAVRHALMVEAWLSEGAQVCWAWPMASPDVSRSPEPPASCEGLALDSPDELALWIKRNRPNVVVLGYWELESWLPTRLGAALVLDYIAPRLLERQFEDRERLPGDVRALLPLLARVDEVWVGNARQLHFMVPLMLLAGHDCRERAPVVVVPIAGHPIAERLIDLNADADESAAGKQPISTHSDRLKLFHGGRDWPWRQSKAWLDVLQRDDMDVELIDASEQAGYGSLDAYRRALAEADLLIELSENNLERRYSQSFRAVDALCAGVPLIVNRFLPLASTIEQHAAGWLVDSPEALPALLRTIASNRDELNRRADNALMLAQKLFDVNTVYRPLAARMSELAPPEEPRMPLVGDAFDASPGLLRVTRDHFSRWVHHRLRMPFHRWMNRRLAHRPKPSAENSTWVVVSRPDIFPTDHGAAVKIERTAWGLSFHVDEVLLLTDRRDGHWRYCQGQREFHRFPTWLRLPGWPRAFNLMRLMARGMPYSNAFLYLPLVDRGLHMRLMWLLSRHPVEVVQGEFPAYAHPAVWAARLFGTGSLMVEHNVEYRRIAEQVPELTESARQWLKRTEVDLANACDGVVTVSDADREALIQAGVQPGRLHTIPHGVDLQAFEKSDAVDLRAQFGIEPEKAVFVYHGIYSYPPNLAAVEELSQVILPALAKRGHPAHVVAIGPEPPDRDLPGVSFSGPVNDLAGHLKGGDLAVIPLRSGGGTRMKILDDFAASVSVVATTKGAEGIPVESGRQLIIADDTDAIVDAVIALLDDASRRKTLAANARAWVDEFDWRAIAARYVAMMRKRQSVAGSRKSCG